MYLERPELACLLCQVWFASLMFLISSEGQISQGETATNKQIKPCMEKVEIVMTFYYRQYLDDV